MTTIEALGRITATYDAYERLTYEQIAEAINGLSVASLADLKAAADRFGVVPLKATKQSILEAVRSKIERRKLNLTRCNF